MSARRAHPSPEAFAEALCAFVNDELPALHARLGRSPGVTPATPLFATGLLDSLAVLHVVAWVEEAIGRPLAIDEVVMNRFQDARTIAASFWTAPSATAEESHALTR
ncbi:MAG TPA: hypothetical protein VEB66_08430 [Opitutaceae bacterium]|nr:hypothetical protein [Opitutaceae bacterium]